MDEKNAINFLLYSYFSITLVNEDDQLVDAAINRAYRDASSRVLTITSDADKFKLKRDAIKVFKDPKMRKRRASPEAAYDAWFYNVCNALKEVYNGQKFCFGHAQKWVNMTMKYLYVLKSVFAKYGEERLSMLPDGLEMFLHVPADGYMIEAVGYGSAGAWSTWDEEKTYKGFKEKADKMRQGKPPLDWEGPTWIDVAIQRREKELARLEKKFK